MKLNCDMGESFGAYSIGRDDEVMPYVHMANIACGAHGGDPMVMEKTVLLARAARSNCRCSPGVSGSAGIRPSYHPLFHRGNPRDAALSGRSPVRILPGR